MAEMALPASALEDVFTFRHPDFRQYMSVSHRLPRPEELSQYSSSMAEAEHPLVRCAAGWAAAELAQYGSPEPNGYTPEYVTFQERLEALQAARTIWAGVKQDLRACQNTQPALKHKLWMRDIGLRLERAVAYLPLMEVAASLLAATPLTPEEVESRLQQTRRAATAAGVAELALPSKSWAHHNRRLGLISESVCGLIGQMDEPLPLRHIILPASLRQDNDRRQRTCADWIAMSAEPPHLKVPIQVTAGDVSLAKGSNESRITVVAQKDLVFKPEGGVYWTLVACDARDAGTAPPEHLAALNVLARVITLRVDAFNRSRSESA